MKWTLVLVAALLSSCATSNSLREGPLFISLKAERPPEQVAACIATAWGRTKNFNTRLEQAGDRTDVILSGSTVGGSDMIASVFNDGRVTMAKRKAAWSGMDDQRAADVRRCSVNL